MEARTRHIVPALAVALVLQGTMTAQVADPAQRAYRTSLLGTVIPVGVGVALLAASDLKSDEALAGYVLASLGASIGPALGHWQQGHDARGWAGASGRLFLTWGSLAMAAAVVQDCDAWACWDDQITTASLILVVGHAAATLWAVCDAASVRRAQACLPTWRGPWNGPQFSLAPTYVPGERAPGLVLWAEF